MDPQDLKGIPTGKSDKCWLERVSERLNGQGIAPPISNPWYQSAFREIEKLEDAVQTLMNQNNTLNDKLIASLKGGKIEELEAAVRHEQGHSKAMLKEFNAAAEEIADLKVKLTNAKANGETEKVYLRGRIKVLLHQVSSLSGILADVSGKHAERINTGIPTPVHLMNQ